MYIIKSMLSFCLLNSSLYTLVAQLLAVPLGDNGVDIPALKIHLNVYTAPAFASIFVTALNAAVILIWYSEHRVDIYKDQENDVVVQKFSKSYFFFLTYLLN